MLDDGTQGENPPEAPEEKPKPVKKAAAAPKHVAAKPPVDESIQTQKEIHASFESPLEEASKSQGFSNLVE